MYALSVVLGVLAVAVTCTSAVVALTMVRSRDARIERLQRHISSLQDHYSHEVGKAECELWNLRGDYDTLRRAYEATFEDHDVLMASYDALRADYEEAMIANTRLEGQLNSYLFSETADEQLHRWQSRAYAAQAELLDAHSAIAQLRHELDCLINGSTSRDDHEDGPCDCAGNGVPPMCDACDPWGVTL